MRALLFVSCLLAASCSGGKSSSATITPPPEPNPNPAPQPENVPGAVYAVQGGWTVVSQTLISGTDLNITPPIPIGSYFDIQPAGLITIWRNNVPMSMSLDAVESRHGYVVDWYQNFVFLGNTGTPGSVDFGYGWDTVATLGWNGGVRYQYGLRLVPGSVGTIYGYEALQVQYGLEVGGWISLITLH